MHPKNQVIKKEKLAKCYNTILMNPHQVCQSSAINFNRFAGVIEKIYDEDRDSINEDFFRKCVSSVILFDTLDSLIGKASWYPKGGNKAQIVPYTIAKLMTLIPKGKDIDWHYIWQKQTLYTELAEELLKLSYCTHKFLMDQANGGIVRTISRTQAVWKNFQNYQYSLSETFLATLVSIEETKSAERAAKRAHKFDAAIDASVEIFNLGANYWMKVYNDLMKGNVLSYGDCSFIKGIADYIAKQNLPSASQCKRLIKIVNKAEEADILVVNTCGFIESAKEEAINTILEMAEYKKKNCQKLIVMGCLVERYQQELSKAIPEVDLFIRIKEYDSLWEQIENLLGDNKSKDKYKEEDVYYYSAGTITDYITGGHRKFYTFEVYFDENDIVKSTSIRESP